MKVELSIILNIIEEKTSWGKEQLKMAILKAMARESNESIGFVEKKENEFLSPCTRCGSSHHTTGEKSCCNCSCFIAPNQKCRKGRHTTRDAVCSQWVMKSYNKRMDENR